jgi:CheY-like chemotaxis protein
MSVSARKRVPGCEDFLVLLVEDNKELRRNAKTALEKIDGVFVVEASGPAEARQAIKRHYVDAAVVDLKLRGSAAAGFGVIDDLEARAPKAPIVIWTNHLRAETVVKYLGDEQIVRAVRKGKDRHRDLTTPIEAAVHEWRARAVSVEQGEIVRDLVWARREHPAYELPDSPEELERELDRVYRRLFGAVRGLEGEAEVKVKFREIEREGLSSAVTAEGVMTIGSDATGEPVRGNRCVVKIGPIKEIEAEVERYQRFVKFGVRLAQRVELLSSTIESSVGGIAYSFAGGVFGQSLVSLDKVLHRPDGQHLATKAIKELFNPKRKSWYGVRCVETAPTDYMYESYSTDFDECFDALHASLEKVQGKSGQLGISFSKAEQDKAGWFTFKGGELVIPPTNFAGTSLVFPKRKACLVHGDMHGGNVMIELGGNGKKIDTAKAGALTDARLERVCLIDYRSAGPGPRAVDAVALQASIRLADASAIKARFTDGNPKKKLRGAALADAARVAANRVQTETTWFERSWSGEPDGKSTAGEDAEPWIASSALLTARMRATFKEMQPAEYLAIAIPCVIRQFGYEVGTVARVRLLAWLSALYSAAVKLESAEEA